MTNDWYVMIKTDMTFRDLQGLVHVWADVYDSDGVFKGAISFTRDVPLLNLGGIIYDAPGKFEIDNDVSDRIYGREHQEARCLRGCDT